MFQNVADRAHYRCSIVVPRGVCWVRIWDVLCNVWGIEIVIKVPVPHLRWSGDQAPGCMIPKKLALTGSDGTAPKHRPPTSLRTVSKN
jgi:hypothetical protein